ncbi:MAG: hypothetical protein HOQ15_12010 [Gemmatimonadaceae bacterium]|nr:hypothetical protein [Gemmatimonadaceae bacterium]
MKEVVVAAIAAAVVVACADAPRGPSLKERMAAQAAAVPPAPLAYQPAVAMCTDTSEAAAMRCADGVAMRAGDTIILRLSTVGAAKRVDNPQEGDGYRRYYYAGRFGGDNGTPAFHILDVRNYEGGAIELINAATGDSLLLRGVPILSPDGARFAAVEEPDACELASQLEVWRVTGDQPIRELSLQPFDCDANTGWGPSDVKWRTRDTIALVRNRLPRDSTRRANGERDASPALLVRSAGTWVLDTASSAGQQRKVRADSL